MIVSFSGKDAELVLRLKAEHEARVAADRAASAEQASADLEQDAAVERASLARFLDAALDRLSPRDRSLVSLVREGATLEAAGATVGLSKERTRQIVDDFIEGERARIEGRAPRGRWFREKRAA